MAQIEARKRKDGSVTYYVRWIDPDTKQRMTQRVDSKESAEFLHTVLSAHGGDVGQALNAARDYYSGVYTVTRMIEDHIALLTSAKGYTVRRYKANLACHIAQTLGTMDAARVEYRDIVGWIKGMQAKGLSPKTIANVHGLISAAFNAMVRDKRRPDNPCKGVSLPKSEATEETATFLTRAEWDLVEGELAEPYRTFFTFLIHTGLRFSEATALEARDFQINASGQHVVNVVRAWTKDEDNVSYIGPTKTRQSKRTVALTAGAYSLIRPLLKGKPRQDSEPGFGRFGGFYRQFGPVESPESASLGSCGPSTGNYACSRVWSSAFFAWHEPAAWTIGGSPRSSSSSPTSKQTSPPTPPAQGYTHKPAGAFPW